MSSPASAGIKKDARSCQTPELLDALAALSRLAGLWPGEIVDPENPAFAGLLANLRRSLRAERQRGLSGHWSYDLARHAELVAVYRILTDAHRGRVGSCNVAASGNLRRSAPRKRKRPRT